jgi:hypothetical protein
MTDVVRTAFYEAPYRGLGGVGLLIGKGERRL